MLKFADLREEIDCSDDVITVSKIKDFSCEKVFKLVKKYNKLFFFLDVNEITDIDSLLKKIIYLFFKSMKNNIVIGENLENEVLYGYVLKAKDESNRRFETLLDSVFKILDMSDISKIYSYIYDEICDDLDNKFSKCNYCDFSNDMCVAQKLGISAHSTMGCCYMHTYSKIMSVPKDLGICKYLDGKKCSEKCMACKLFTCKYLRKRGISFSINDYEIYRNFFTKKQCKILKETFFTPKEEVIKLLLKDYKICLGKVSCI